MKAKLLEELRCQGCSKQLSKGQTLWDTAWLGVYWCGKSSCAMKIMESHCKELNIDDKTNHEWDCICPVCK